ncbi:J domain-containing protein [Pseudomonas citronellolis]|uniref:J domain-containing protein n=1 Tax=Pseudomonas citronellolis TaxID=53408 RepID=UPI000778E4E6|nr:J domain-containing protein [Pseudomonas citronellolis]AMO74494.1 DnaJ domain protein [Pseudomonas citronellolis]
MSCWEILGLEAEADERSIKRQYARLLKVTRPDEDAQAFQALREAYEQAMSFAQWRERGGTEDGDDDIAVAAPPLAASPLHSVAVEVPFRSLASLLEDLRPDELSERLRTAEAEGLALSFEDGVLQLCLADARGTGLRDAACETFGWLRTNERSGLSAQTLRPLWVQLLGERLDALRELHEQDGGEAFVRGLAALAGEPWLQSFDARELLETAVVRLLLDLPYCSGRTLDEIAALFRWNEGQRDASCPAHLWHALLDRWDAERFYDRLQNDARRWELTSECRAARLVLGPFDRFQRRRFSADFTEADWDCSRRVAETLRHRYPQLTRRLPLANSLDAGFWHDLARSETRWPRVLMLWLGFMLMYAIALMPAELAKPSPNLTQLFISVPVTSVLLAASLDKLLRISQRFLGAPLKRLDYYLSSLLPAALHEHGAGLRPLRDGAIGYLLGLGAAMLAGWRGHEVWWGGLILAVPVLGAMQLLRRTSLLGRAQLLLERGWAYRRNAFFIGVLLLAGLAAIAGSVSKNANQVRRQVPNMAPAELERFCSDLRYRRDLVCLRWQIERTPPLSGD